MIKWKYDKVSRHDMKLINSRGELGWEAYAVDESSVYMKLQYEEVADTLPKVVRNVLVTTEKWNVERVRTAMVAAGWYEYHIAPVANSTLESHYFKRYEEQEQPQPRVMKTETTSARTKICNKLDFHHAMIAAGWTHTKTERDGAFQTAYYEREVPA